MIKFGTNSVLALQYIKNETHQCKVYVANRATEIRQEISVSQWNHVQGKNNPTDSGSRVKSLHDLLQSTPKGVM